MKPKQSLSQLYRVTSKNISLVCAMYEHRRKGHIGTCKKFIVSFGLGDFFKHVQDSLNQNNNGHLKNVLSHWRKQKVLILVKYTKYYDPLRTTCPQKILSQQTHINMTAVTVITSTEVTSEHQTSTVQWSKGCVSFSVHIQLKERSLLDEKPRKYKWGWHKTDLLGNLTVELSGCNGSKLEKQSKPTV